MLAVDVATKVESSVVVGVSGLMAFDDAGDLYVSERDSLRVLRVFPLATGVADGNADAKHLLSIGVNVPNPFNPSTTIAFSLPAAGTADLRVYDVTGRLVSTLVDEPKDAGLHEVRWDGRDSGGIPVANGVYLVRLRAGTDVAMKKIVLLK